MQADSSLIAGDIMPTEAESREMARLYAIDQDLKAGKITPAQAAAERADKPKARGTLTLDKGDEKPSTFSSTLAKRMKNISDY